MSYDYSKIENRDIADQKIERFCREIEDSIINNKEYVYHSINEVNGSIKTISTTNQVSADTITRLFAIAKLSLNLIKTNRTSTLRDVYYCLKHLFRDQAHCNQTILTLGAIIKLTRIEMRIFPAGKGFVAGLLSFQFEKLSDISITNSILEKEDCVKKEICLNDNRTLIDWMWTNCAQAILHPYSSSMILPMNYLKIGVPSMVKCIILIEKEGVFERLCEEKFYERVPSILITACGFPNIATRSIVALLSHIYPHLRVFCLTDYNVYGMQVMLTYKIPTLSMSYESSGLCVRKTRWIGLRGQHIEEFLKHQPNLSVYLQPINEFDHNKTISLIKTLSELEMSNHVEELKGMLKFGYKMELEGLYAMDVHALSKYLERTILTMDTI